MLFLLLLLAFAIGMILFLAIGYHNLTK